MDPAARPMISRELPDFAIVGAQKSASTFIQDGLSSHQDIYMPKGETRYFEDPEYLGGDISTLTSLFKGREGKVKGIKRPDYLGRAEVPARMKAVTPDIKIIVVLRNPVERLVSAYYYYIKLGFIPVLDINEAIPRILKGEAIGTQKARDLLEYGRYATHLERYLSCFPKDQLLILMQEDIASSPKASLETSCGFLGVDPGKVRAPLRRVNAGVYPLARLRFLTKRNRFLYRYDDETGKLAHRKMHPGRYVPAAIITTVDRYLLERVIGNKKPELHEDVRSMLVQFYREEVNETERIIGRDLRNWK
jgi:hypothetical protein